MAGITLYEMHAPLIMLAKQKLEAKQISNEQFKEQIQHVVRVLEEALRILSLEPATSAEGVMAKAAKTALDQMKRFPVSV